MKAEMKKATGNTYNVKEDLKSVGFHWNNEARRFEAESFDAEKWEAKYCNPTWNGRKQARLCSEVKIDNV